MECLANAEREYNTKVTKLPLCAATQSRGSAKTQKGSKTRKSQSTTVCGLTEYRKPESAEREYYTKATMYHHCVW
jgi:hypothetical protein